MACHGTINGNMITDFGYDPDSNDLFLGGGSDVNLNPVVPSRISITSSRYFMWGAPNPYTWDVKNTTASSSHYTINGTLFIPEVNINLESMPKAFKKIIPNDLITNNTVTLNQIISNPLAINSTPSHPLTNVIKPSSPTASPTQEVSSVYIGAPTSKEINDIVKNNSNLISLNNDQSKTIFLSKNSNPVDLTATQKQGQIMEKTGNFSKYIVNNTKETMNCFGDVVILTTLYLNKVTINTDNNGCRLYVDGSVYINGGVKFTSEKPDPHLQITSSQAIMIGFTPARIARRLSVPRAGQEDYNVFITRTTRKHKSPTEIEDFTYLIYNQALDINATYPSNQQLTNDSQETNPELNHLLLNAIEINSNYGGALTNPPNPLKFSGVLIGEIVFLSSGTNFNFTFNFDPLFANLNTNQVLPLLPKQPLILEK
jgi:hypothetical protein